MKLVASRMALSGVHEEACQCAGLVRLPRRGCQHGQGGWIQNMYNLHFITYYWRTCISCLANEAVVTSLKIQRPQGLFLALLQGCALRSRAVVKQQGTRSDSPWDPARASKPWSSCFSYSIQMAFVRLPNSADMSCLAALCEERADPDGTQHSHS